MAPSARARINFNFVAMIQAFQPRAIARKLLWSALVSRANAMTKSEFEQDAWVIVPHQDDEVLSCGGTIMRKLAHGARIRIAFLTDGSNSHDHPEGKEALREARREEAISACRVMGVPESDLIFFNFPDGCLTENAAEASSSLANVLRKQPGEQIFLPFRRDEHPDHVGTHVVVSAALDNLGLPIDRWEYGTWFWNHWPWVPVRKGGFRSRLGFAKYSAELSFYLMRDFRYSVDVSEYVIRKRAALDEHRSQMARKPGSKNWMTLEDFSDGEWLACFFRSHELFCRKHA